MLWASWKRKGFLQKLEKEKTNSYRHRSIITKSSGEILCRATWSSFDVEKRAGIPSIFGRVQQAGTQVSIPVAGGKGLARPLLVSAHIRLCLCPSRRCFGMSLAVVARMSGFLTRSNYSFLVLARILPPRSRCLRGPCCCSQDCPCSGGDANRTTLLVTCTLSISLRPELFQCDRSKSLQITVMLT